MIARKIPSRFWLISAVCKRAWDKWLKGKVLWIVTAGSEVSAAHRTSDLSVSFSLKDSEGLSSINEAQDQEDLAQLNTELYFKAGDRFVVVVVS